MEFDIIRRRKRAIRIGPIARRLLREAMRSRVERDDGEDGGEDGEGHVSGLGRDGL